MVNTASNRSAYGSSCSEVRSREKAMPRARGPGQHARGQVSARDPVTGRGQHREVLARPARRVQDCPVGRDQAQHPGHPCPLHLPGVLVIAIRSHVASSSKPPESSVPQSRQADSPIEWSPVVTETRPRSEPPWVRLA
jgi:hypothetical protein